MDKDAGEATITAADDATVQKAVDAVAAAGFHGKTDSKTVTFKDDSGAKNAKVKSLTVSGAHLCCGKCIKAANKALGTITGATAAGLKKGAASFTVTGDFNDKTLVDAFNNVGMHVKVK